MRIKVWAAAVALAFVFSGAALAADGKKIFQSKCMACHGNGGAGTPMAPALKGNSFVKDTSVDELKKLLANGREGAAKKYPQFPIAMPKQGLNDADAEAVIGYIKSLQ